jgi:hypothetical protein
MLRSIIWRSIIWRSIIWRSIIRRIIILRSMRNNEHVTGKELISPNIQLCNERTDWDNKERKLMHEVSVRTREE